MKRDARQKIMYFYQLPAVKKTSLFIFGPSHFEERNPIFQELLSI